MMNRAAAGRGFFVSRLAVARRRLLSSFHRHHRIHHVLPSMHIAPSASSSSSSSFSSSSFRASSSRRHASSSSSSVVTSSNNNLPPSSTDEKHALIPFTQGGSDVCDIQGQESHTAIIRIKPGEVLRAESGAMLFMSQGVVMDTSLQGASSAFTRFLTGQNVFLSDFRYEGGHGEYGEVGLGTDFPSKILRFRLDDFPNANLICQRGALLASNGVTVNIETEFTKSLTAGFFGGQGFILQRIVGGGGGEVLVKGGGTIVHKRLQDGERLRVTSGSIVAFESTVQYDVQMMPGVKNAMFGEGLFITKLVGPGQVWLQGMPPDRFISEIARRVPSGGGIGLGVPIGMGGGSSGGEEGVDAAAAGGAADEAASSGEDMVAATDEAVNADRQATVAASGMESGGSDEEVDADSPNALFGDAAAPAGATPADTSGSADDDSGGFTDDSFGGMDDQDMSSSTDTTTSTDDDAFYDEETSFSSNDKEDSFGFSSSEEQQQDQQDFTDGELFDDAGEAMSDDGGAVGDEEGGSSIFGTLWDIFMGGDE